MAEPNTSCQHDLTISVIVEGQSDMRECVDCRATFSGRELAKLRAASPVAPPESMDELASNIANEMLDNLRHNVGQQRAKLASPVAGGSAETDEVKPFCVCAEVGDDRCAVQCAYCAGGCTDADFRAMTAHPEVAGGSELDKEITRWQRAIYDLCRKESGDDTIDGGGCDSGDPLDFTLAEISEAFGILKEKLVPEVAGGSASNYIADREQAPQWVAFANGRTVGIAFPQGQRPHLVIGWEQPGERRLRSLGAAEDDAGCVNIGDPKLVPEGWEPEGGKGGDMIQIQKSQTADTRTCDFANTSKETLLASSHQHIGDVRAALEFMRRLIEKQAEVHDHDKISDIDGFHRDFLTGFKQTEWWDKHRKVNRHHLLQADGVPQDVNLIDVLDMICDCVMAGMARSGSVYPLNIDPEVLMRAFQNTVDLLKANVEIVG